MIFFLVGPLAFIGYFLAAYYLFRRLHYRWPIWLWLLTFFGQLPLFYQWDWAWMLVSFMFEPLRSWLSEFKDHPATAIGLLALPSLASLLAYWVQRRRLTRPPTLPSPARPARWLLAMGVYFALLLVLVWWLSKR